MIDVHYCSGCRDDFYNGHNDLGVKKCWMREKAKIVERVFIHIDQMPPYKNIKREKVPDCYHKQRFVAAKPSDIGSDGYWRSA